MHRKFGRQFGRQFGRHHSEHHLSEHLGDHLGDATYESRPYWMHPNIEKISNSQICLYMFPIEGLVVIKAGGIIHEDIFGGFRLILLRSNQETSTHDMFTPANV